MQYVQEFYQTVRDKCFKVCVTSPGSSLSGSEQKCLGRCMDRYQDVSGSFDCFAIGAAIADDDAASGSRRARTLTPLSLSPPAKTKTGDQRGDQGGAQPAGHELTIMSRSILGAQNESHPLLKNETKRRPLLTARAETRAPRTQ